MRSSCPRPYTFSLLSGLVAWSTFLGTATFANGSPQLSTIPPQAEEQTVYVGPGCDTVNGSNYWFYEDQEIRGAGDTDIEPINWEELSGQGYCGLANYITKEQLINRPSSGIFSLVLRITPATWAFRPEDSENVSIAIYIPGDDYEESIARFRFPPLPVMRQVSYTVQVSSQMSDDEPRVCIESTEIDQGDYQDEFVDLGTCQVSESETVYVLLTYEDSPYERSAIRVVGDVVRFTTTSSISSENTDTDHQNPD